MKLATTLLFSSLFAFVFSQNAIVDTLKIIGTNPWDNGTNELYFPVVRTYDSLVHMKINGTLAAEYQNAPQQSTIEASLDEWAKEGLVSLDFVISYNKNKIISLQIANEYCIAYCSNWTDYFNFSTETGELLQLSDLIDTTQFLPIVRKDHGNYFRTWRTETRDLMMINSDEFTNEDYNYTMEYGKECEDGFSVEQFALTDIGLTVYQDCLFPHAMLSLSPIVEMHYSYAELAPFLKLKLGK